MTQKKQNLVKNKAFGNVVIKRQNRTENNIRKELFIGIIKNLEDILVRQENLFSNTRLDFSSYDEIYFKVIDDLLWMNFGDSGMELIEFYLYSRFNIDGSENKLLDETGTIIPCDTPTDLWNLINKSNAIS